ncbi:MAG: 30S ribosomal protein S20 [Gaiellaceae bacterium]
MANIKQQKKRVGITARQRIENLRYRSTVKTISKRLHSAVDAGEKATIEAEHKLLVQWIDKAAANGAMHRNAAARKKSQAARLVAGK